MTEVFARVWERVGHRLRGPLHLRFDLQPAAAVIGESVLIASVLALFQSLMVRRARRRRRS